MPNEDWFELLKKFVGLEPSTTAPAKEWIEPKSAHEETMVLGEAVWASLSKISTNVNDLSEDVSDLKKSFYTLTEDLGLEVDEQNLLIDLRAPKSFKNREEFKTMWAAQKKEYDYISEEAKNPSSQAAVSALVNDPSRNTATNQADVDLLVNARRKIYDHIASLKSELVESEKKAEKRREYATFLANLSYAYILMAVHFKVAREHVSSVIQDRETSELALNTGLFIVEAAFRAGIAALSGGISGVFLAYMSETDAWKEVNKWAGIKEGVPFKANEEDTSDNRISALEKTTAEATAQDQEVTKGEAFTSASKNSLQASLAGSITDATTNTIEKVVGSMSGPRANLFSRETPENTLEDPFDFFMKKEAELRQTSAYVMSISEVDELDQLPCGLAPGLTLGEMLKGKGKWNILFSAQNKDKAALDEIWGDISKLLRTDMKRACWREFCRSQWNNMKYSYTLTVGKPEAESEWASTLIGPASEWHYMAWEGTVGVGGRGTRLMPRHWNQICSDFKGPEHDPRDRLNVKHGRVNRAHTLMERKSWISLAAVTCCQIKRDFWARCIDLEKYGHHGGSQTDDPIPPPNGWSDKDLVFGNIKDQRFKDHKGDSQLSNYLKRICIKGGIDVQINEIRFGKESSWFRATGKKGLLAEKNEPSEAPLFPLAVKASVTIRRTGSSGDETRSFSSARANLYRVVNDEKGKELKHEGNKPCEEGAYCFYCLNADDLAKGGVEDTYRLKRIVAEDETWMQVGHYINFTVPDKKENCGLYCVALDAKKELQDGTRFSDPQFHHSEPWWFRVSDKVEFDSEPQQPTIVELPPSAWIPPDPNDPGRTLLIRGKYANLKDSDPKPTQIHVFISDQTYPANEINAEVSPAQRDWDVTVPQPYPGQKVSATATWVNKDGVALQSEVFETILFPLQAPKLTGSISAGSTLIKGQSNAVEGSTIQVMINGTEHGSPISLMGARNKNQGLITWSLYDPNIGLRYGDTVSAKVSANGRTSPLSAVVKVGKPEAPILDDIKFGAQEVTGHTGPVADVEIEIKIPPSGTKSIVQKIVGDPDWKDQVQWKVPVPRKFEDSHSLKVEARIRLLNHFREEDFSDWRITYIGGLNAAEVDPLFYGMKVISGKNKPYQPAEIDMVWIEQNGEITSHGQITIIDTLQWSCEVDEELKAASEKRLKSVILKYYIGTEILPASPSTVKIDVLPPPTIEDHWVGSEIIRGTVAWVENKFNIPKINLVINGLPKELPLTYKQGNAGVAYWESVVTSSQNEIEFEATLKLGASSSQPEKKKSRKLPVPKIDALKPGETDIHGSLDEWIEDPENEVEVVVFIDGIAIQTGLAPTKLKKDSKVTWNLALPKTSKTNNGYVQFGRDITAQLKCGNATSLVSPPALLLPDLEISPMVEGDESIKGKILIDPSNRSAIGPSSKVVAINSTGNVIAQVMVSSTTEWELSLVTTSRNPLLKKGDKVKFRF